MRKIFLLSFFIAAINANPLFKEYSIFPIQNKHVHGSSIIELPNGDLLSCWFHGSGERKANDVQIKGSRLKKGSNKWGDVFDMADTPSLLKN